MDLDANACYRAILTRDRRFDGRLFIAVKTIGVYCRPETSPDRLFKQHLGASPVAVAQTRRVLLAKPLIHDTQLPMAEVTLAAGFGSVRRFNETFRALFGRPPGHLRRSKRAERWRPWRAYAAVHLWAS